MKRNRSVESNAADAVLQREKDVVVGGVTYKVAPPSTATIIMASELIAEMPEVRPTEELSEQLQESLRVGRNCKILGDILALLILGPKNLIENKQITTSHFFGLFKRTQTIEIDRQKELAAVLLIELTPKRLYELSIELFSRIQVSHFFALTTSLSDVNILKPTKEVV